MDNSELESAIKAANITIKKAADFKMVYANVCRTTVGPFDIRLQFAVTVETEGKAPGQSHQEDVVTVILSPVEAKAVSQLVLEAVATYEKTYTEIKDLTPMLKQMLIDRNKSNT
jgi:Protein of unknown function (DUF3467)